MNIKRSALILFLFMLSAWPCWAQTVYVNGATSSNPGPCIATAGGTTVCYGGSTAALALTFGSTSIPLSSTAPTSGKYLAYNGSAIVGLNASGIGACAAKTWASTLNNGAAPTCTSPLPLEVALANQVGQTAAITATVIYAVPSGAAGTYRVTFAAKVTTPAGTSSVLGGGGGFQVVYTDPDTVAVTTPVETYNSDSTTLALNTTQAVYSGTIIVNAAQSTNIQYQFGYTSVAGLGAAMAYNIHVRVEAL